MAASTTDLVTESKNELNTSKNVNDLPKSFFKISVSKKCSYLKSYITVEPIIASYVMAAVLCAPALLHLNYKKACLVNLGYNDTVCNAVLTGNYENFTFQNNEVNIKISNTQSWQYPLQSVTPIVLVLFLGSYSDRHKLRKPFLILPLIGELLSVTGCILCVIFMEQLSLEILGIFQIVLPSFFGGQPMIVMAVFSYIADVSSIEMRTLRIGIVQIVLNFVYPFVQSFSALLFVQLDYIGILLIAGSLYAFGIFYCLFWIKEPKDEFVTKKNLCVDLFDPRYATEAFALLFKRSSQVKLVTLYVLLLTIFVTSGVTIGEGNSFILYSQSVFQWTVVEITYFISTNTIVHLLGSIVAVPLFTKVMKLSDSTILLLTLIDKIIANVIFVIAKTSLWLYVAVFVSFLTGVTNVALRSMASKSVSADDLGKAQSLFAVCEALAPAIFLPIYNKAIFNNTLEIFPAAFLLFGMLLFIGLGILIFLVTFSRKQKSIKTSNVSTSFEKPVTLEETTHM